MTLCETAPPRWDMTTVFPSLDSRAFKDAFEHVIGEIESLNALLDTHDVRRREKAVVDAAFATAYEEVTNRFNDLLPRMSMLHTYIGSFTTTEADNDLAQTKQSLLEMHRVKLDPLRTRYVAWIGSSDIDTLLRLSPVARSHEYMLRQAQVQAKHQMSEAEENLASEIQPSALTGWAHLHGNMSALLTVPVSIRGEERTLPMSAVRSLASDRDRSVRKAAFEAELKAWESIAVPFAAALNGVKGFQQTLRRRRGYADDLEPTLVTNSIDRPTLEGMQQACVEALPDFRRYMDAKARALELDHLAWYDLNAPLSVSSKTWTWEEATAFVQENFACYSQRLAEFAARSFRERWIDAEPRVGKRGGAYCARVRDDESRVLMNFDGSFVSICTLAHELGHAYHNLNLASRTALQRSTPMTLAETASIFCETLIISAALEKADREERLTLLDTQLQRNLMVVVDIHSRFLFERDVFERRAARDLTAAEFCDLITQAQRQTFGERVDPLHPYMWSVKGHYYGPTFYNYPYTFGLLFGLGLYRHYQQSPDLFRERYDAFLSSTGMADAATLGRQFDVDVTKPDFWRSSLDVIRQHIEEFESLVDG